MNKFQKGGGSRGKSSGGYNKSSKFGGNNGGSRFGGGDRGGSRFGGGSRDRDDDRPEMHKATCAECGDRCEVPFRPNGKRPVLCSVCYKQDSGPRDFGAQRHTSTFQDRDDRREDRGGDRGGDRYPTPRPRMETAGVSPELAAQLKEINEKLDVLIEVLTMEEGDMDDEMEDDEEGIEVNGEDNQA